ARSGGQAVRDALELLLNVPELTVGHSHSRVEQAGSVGRLPGAAGRCRPRAVSSAGSLLVDARLEASAGCDLREKRVGVRLFVERLIEQLLGLAQVELVGQRAGGAVRGDLVVLGPLRRGDQG